MSNSASAFASGVNKVCCGVVSIVTPSGPINVHYAQPDRLSDASTAILVLHGKDREAERYRDQWAVIAQERKILVVVPEFDVIRFAGWRRYNMAGMLDSKGKIRPRRKWLFASLDTIRTQAALLFGIRQFELFGHSADAQLLFRYAMFNPHLPQHLPIMVANAGWYTMPSAIWRFPYGLGSAPEDVDLERFFSRPLTILVGDRDTDEGHHALRRNAIADDQGKTRLRRAKTCMEQAQRACTDLGWNLAWRLKIIDGATHSNSDVVDAIAALKIL